MDVEKMSGKALQQPPLVAGFVTGAAIVLNTAITAYSFEHCMSTAIIGFLIAVGLAATAQNTKAAWGRCLFFSGILCCIEAFALGCVYLLMVGGALLGGKELTQMFYASWLFGVPTRVVFTLLCVGAAFVGLVQLKKSENKMTLAQLLKIPLLQHDVIDIPKAALTMGKVACAVIMGPFVGIWLEEMVYYLLHLHDSTVSLQISQAGYEIWPFLTRPQAYIWLVFLVGAAGCAWLAMKSSTPRMAWAKCQILGGVLYYMADAALQAFRDNHDYSAGQIFIAYIYIPDFYGAILIGVGVALIMWRWIEDYTETPGPILTSPPTPLPEKIIEEDVSEQDVSEQDVSETPPECEEAPATTSSSATSEDYQESGKPQSGEEQSSDTAKPTVDWL